MKTILQIWYIHAFMHNYVTACAKTALLKEIASILLTIRLKALPPVCMKYTARNESEVANIAQGEAKCSHQELYILYKVAVF